VSRAAIRSAIVEFEPALENWPSAGVYQLWLCVTERTRLRAGGLGLCTFPAGEYVYTGRAARGLVARVQRHARGCGGLDCAGSKPPKKHWHIDYLLASPNVHIDRVVLASSDPTDECQTNQSLAGHVVVAGFGSSDCVNGCGAHLVCLDTTID
jgi:Uri superfamily endonuclease